MISAGPGSYLVRPSDNSPGDYSLFFHINNQIQRFRVEKKGVRYVMGGRTFECLDAVINRYKTEQIVEGHTLGHPVKRVSTKKNIRPNCCILSDSFIVVACRNACLIWNFIRINAAKLGANKCLCRKSALPA